MARALINPLSPLVLVALVFDDGYKLALNRGRTHNIQEGQQYLVFNDGPVIEDPETGDVLGKLELIRGRGKIIKVEEKYSILESLETQATAAALRNSPTSMIAQFDRLEDSYTPAPFYRAEKGDKARPI